MLSTALVSTRAGVPEDVNWDPRFVPPPGVNGQVYATATIGSNLYVGGFFSTAGGKDIRNLARWDGQEWHGMGDLDGPVLALITDGADLYVGGRFNQAGAVAATNIARWNGTGWQSLGAGLSGGFSMMVGGPAVFSLAFDGNVLYAGGTFRQAGSLPATNIARWDGTNWFSLGAGITIEPGDDGGGVPPVTPNALGRPGPSRRDYDPSVVHSVAVQGSELYAGGLFSRAGGVFATNIARWDGTNWSALGSGVTGGFGPPILLNFEPWTGRVYRLRFVEGALLVAGDFTQAGGLSANCLAMWTGTDWTPATGDFNGPVADILSADNSLVVGGAFTTVNGLPAASIARETAGVWARLGKGTRGDVATLAAQDGSLYAGGFFGVAGNASAGSIARWNGDRWSALGSGRGNSIVEDSYPSVVANERGAYVFGSFQTVGVLAVTNAARWTGRHWTRVGHRVPFEPHYSLAAAVGSDIYVVRTSFRPVNGPTDVLRWNGRRWTAVGDPSFNGYIHRVEANQRELYISGFFVITNIGATNLAKWDGTNWSAIPLPPAWTTSSLYNGLAADEHTLYAYVSYSDFSTPGGRIEAFEKWDGTNWTTIGGGLDTALNPTGLSIIGLNSMAARNGTLYVAGYFGRIGDVAVTNLAKWDGSTWSSVGDVVEPDALFVSLAISDTHLYVGGRFETVGGVAARNVAKWDGHTWQPLGSGIENRTDGDSVYVGSLAIFGNLLYLTGNFTHAGAKPSHHFAVWMEPD